MPPGMFDELLERVGHRLSKQRTAYRAPLAPGLNTGFDTAPPCFRLNMCGHAVCLEGATEHYLSCCGATLLQAQHVWTYRMPVGCHRTLSVLLWRHLASGSTFVDMQYAWRVPQNTICLAVAPPCFRLNMCGHAVCL